MISKEISCKTALSPSSLPGLEYSLNPYQGCMHQCRYCYVPRVLHLPYDQWTSIVYVKRNIPLILSKELKRKKPGVVGISTVTDPYQPLEKQHCLTRYCLEQLLRYDFPISIQTKSDLIIRDLDLISKYTSAEVMVSIGTLNESERQYMEPYSSSIERRLKVLETCVRTSVDTSVFFGPIYPTISEKNLSGILDTFIDIGIQKIMIDHFRGTPNIHSEKDMLKGLFSCLSKGHIYDNIEYEQLRRFIKEYLKHSTIELIDAF